MVTKGEISLVLSSFFFCQHVFKKPSTAEASESVFIRESINYYYYIRSRLPICHPSKMSAYTSPISQIKTTCDGSSENSKHCGKKTNDYSFSHDVSIDC